MTEQSTGLVAVDAGGTSTRAVVFHPPGQCLGYAVAGSGNPTAVGPETAAASVAESVMGALRRAEVPSTRIRLVVLAMAGAGRTSVAAEIRRRLAGIGLDAPLVFESDLLATYFSGTHRPDGYAVIAGTGAGAIRVEDGRQGAVGCRRPGADHGGGAGAVRRPAGPARRLRRAGVRGRRGRDRRPHPRRRGRSARADPHRRQVPHRLGSGGARRRHPGARPQGRRSARRRVWREGGPCRGRRGRRRLRPRPPPRRDIRRRGRVPTVDDLTHRGALSSHGCGTIGRWRGWQVPVHPVSGAFVRVGRRECPKICKFPPLRGDTAGQRPFPEKSGSGFWLLRGRVTIRLTSWRMKSARSEPYVVRRLPRARPNWLKEMDDTWQHG